MSHARPCLVRQHKRHEQPVPETCPLCRLFATNRKYNLLWGGDGNVSPAPIAKPLSKADRIRLRFKLPTFAELDRRRAVCEGCEYFKVGGSGLKRCSHGKGCGCGGTLPTTCPLDKWDTLTPEVLVKFDQTNLFPNAVPGYRLNPSILVWQDGYLFVFRDGWKDSNLWLAKLDRGLRPTLCHLLQLSHPRCSYGREDPRIWLFNGRPHVSFTGVQIKNGGMKTHVLYARLGEDLQVEQLATPRYKDRRPWEKNWGFFQHGDDLLAVYSIGPKHRVIRMNGDQVEVVSETDCFPWNGGEPRGGAPPIRVGDEYWNFFHDRVHDEGGIAIYRAGLYTFETNPPFKPLRYIPKPIAVGDVETKKLTNHCDAAFYPAGTIHEGDRWLVSAGEHDRWSTIVSYSHKVLEKHLVKV